MYHYADYEESCKTIKERVAGFVPEIVIVLGSGLGFLANEILDAVSIPYREIPNFRISTAPDHKGRLVFGTLMRRRVAVMDGRLHCYEGYTMEEVAYPVRVLKLLGADKLILTNAAGCVNTAWNAGDLMLIKDHIRLFGFGPLQGPNMEEFGPRFSDSTEIYTEGLRELARKKGTELNLNLREGVYMYFPGPQFETPAEIKAARVLGADAVGMSTVPEATVASHAGMKVLGITVLTNMAAGVSGRKLSNDEVNETAANAAWSFSGLIRSILEDV